MMKNNNNEYWQKNLQIILRLGIIWFSVSLGAGVLFVDMLDNFNLFGYPLGFWFAQQGSIYTFIILIVYYVKYMNKLDKEYGVEE